MMPKQAYFKQNKGQISTKPPQYLGPIAADCWKKIVPYLIATKKVERIDSQIVERYCIAYESYRKAYDDIMQTGAAIEDKKAIQDNTGKIIDIITTRVQKNPQIDIQRDASKEMDTLGQHLGLSPKARQDLLALTNQKDAEDKKKESAIKQMQEFLSGGKKGDDDK